MVTTAGVFQFRCWASDAGRVLAQYLSGSDLFFRYEHTRIPEVGVAAFSSDSVVAVYVEDDPSAYVVMRELARVVARGRDAPDDREDA